MYRLTAVLSLALLAFSVSPATAAHHEAGVVKSDMLKSFEGIEKKLVDLAGAMPADKFGWRPMEGVRSVSETYMHIAAANYFISGALGASMPEGTDVRGLEKNVTSKDAVIAELKKALAHAKAAISGMKADDMATEVDLFGGKRSKHAAALIIVEHMSEHLGQSIAYARSNKIAPPWSR